MGLNPGTHPLTFRHFADRHGTFRNMPLPFPVKLSPCSTHGSRSICFHFPFPRSPAVDRPPFSSVGAARRNGTWTAFKK